ncbi:MAG: TraR/DksA C4-type zinc finger protein [Nannocystaceae bacterium]
MNTPEELTSAERDELRTELRRLEQQLQGAIDLSAEEAAPVDLQTPIGRLSRIDAIAQREISQAGRRQQAQQLGQVRTALAALDDDDFGRCRLCDEPIGFRRLRARPFSTICLRCQAAREQPS